MSLQYRVISIGTLSRNRFWGETEPKRFPHATTTLIRADNETILVDPSLPAEVLAQRLEERSGLKPEQIQAVFLTTFRPIHRRSLSLFSGATWLMYRPEIEAVQAHLNEMRERAQEGPEDPELCKLLDEEESLVARIEAAPEHLTAQTHLFPAVGATPGSAALLLALPTQTAVITGDAIVTQEHFAAGQVYEHVAMIEAARKSFEDILEVADEVVPGHDNVFRIGGL
ncbi:MAG TPA: MBL fold metallo-hydrolase [Phycisphaerae bacterium]|nr:MBL fold metallo-hydrolase [Phycisphaerae bacterium]HRR84566.1 MBL fold metallo-hydrolase [Phycisphaerae bacterium]